MEDLINRRDAIDAIGKASDELYENIKKGATFPQRQWFDGMAKAQSILENLPSADAPERNSGKWLEREVIHAKEAKAIIAEWQSCKCSACGCYDTRPYLYCFNEPRFCSWCGAEMKGEADG